MKTSPRIVLLGGGTGSFTLLQALKNITPNLTAIVSMSDDGGSTGLLRDEYGVLPPGDIRQCLVALSDSVAVRDLFNYRFSQGKFKGQSLGNIILSGLELRYGSFEEAVRVASDILHTRGSVLPVTLVNHRLVMRDGRATIRGEANVANHHIKSQGVTLRLDPEATINPAAARAIHSADIVIIAPGNFYGSLVPIFLVSGLADAIKQSDAQVACVANLVNKPGQTDGWHVVDYVERFEEYIGEDAIDAVLYNNEPITTELLKKYATEGEFPVATEAERFKEVSAQMIGARLVSPYIATQDPADTAIQRTLIRHDSDAVAGQIRKLVS